MINVSQKYIEKATAPGRNVRCRIIADDVVYTDADILSFEFNDVVHPEDMSFGTTCANRFQFELWSRRNIPLSTVIRPYISFVDNTGDDGEHAEQCTLGEFYIARRYRRRNKYSVTCYDRMYRLDSQFVSSLTFPCFASELLAEIGRQFDFKIAFTAKEDVIESVPRHVSNREIIGYIAGINGGFAKFCRDGYLHLKKLDINQFVLNRCQYSELSVKADTMQVRQVEFITEDDIFSEGKGTKLTTYRQKNPFANQEIASRVFEQWKDFEYRGLTVNMRGLPFLESGDAIFVQDDIENEHYVALISDYTLFYDGKLTAKLVSKSKNPVDDYDGPMTQQRMLDSLIENLRVRYFNYRNKDEILLTQELSPIASINFNLASISFIVFNSQFTITANTESKVMIEYHINGLKVGQEPISSLGENKPFSQSLYYNFANVNPGRSTLTVMARMTEGEGVIEKSALIATVSGQYMLGDSGTFRPEINLTQSIGKTEVHDIHFGVVNPREEATGSPLILNPERGFASAQITRQSIEPVSLQLRNFNAVLNTNSELWKAQRIAENKLLLIFTNTISFIGDELDLAGFAVTFGLDDLIIYAAEITENPRPELIITTQNLNEFNEIVIKYDSELGNLLGMASHNPVESFNYILNL